jgi:hypothetical protein
VRRLIAVLRASGLAVALGAIAVAPALTCTTAASPRPVADYRAAPVVVVGTLEQVAPDLVVRVETRHRGPAGDRVTLRRPDSITWCPFPFGAPPAGARVLLAVVDEADWQWPNAALWAVEPDGSIADGAVAPWSGAPAPTTLAEALATMGIAPDTATVPAESADPLPALLLAVAGGLAMMLVRLRAGGSPRR